MARKLLNLTQDELDDILLSTAVDDSSDWRRQVRYMLDNRPHDFAESLADIIVKQLGLS